MGYRPKDYKHPTWYLWWTISPWVYHRPIMAALSWFIRYIYYWHLQWLNNVITIQPKVLLPHAFVTLADFGALGFFYIIRLSNLSIVSVPDDGYPETRHLITVIQKHVVRTELYICFFWYYIRTFLLNKYFSNTYSMGLLWLMAWDIMQLKKGSVIG